MHIPFGKFIISLTGETIKESFEFDCRRMALVGSK